MMDLMMNRPLLISDILDYAAEVHGRATIVSRRVEGDIHRTDYGQTRARVVQMSYALEALGITPGERVATVSYTHLTLPTKRIV